MAKYLVIVESPAKVKTIKKLNHSLVHPFYFFNHLIIAPKYAFRQLFYKKSQHRIDIFSFYGI